MRVFAMMVGEKIEREWEESSQNIELKFLKKF
jgi:hypothetical protein